jgi:hypothetical protein
LLEPQANVSENISRYTGVFVQALAGGTRPG